jgi:hypothetical protein
VGGEATVHFQGDWQLVTPPVSYSLSKLTVGDVF